MASRRLLVAIVLLAAALHAIGMARAILPAQDGLKFIRIAREFQTSPGSTSSGGPTSTRSTPRSSRSPSRSVVRSWAKGPRPGGSRPSRSPRSPRSPCSSPSSA